MVCSALSDRLGSDRRCWQGREECSEESGESVPTETLVITKGILVHDPLAQEIAFCRSFPLS